MTEIKRKYWAKEEDAKLLAVTEATAEIRRLSAGKFGSEKYWQKIGDDLIADGCNPRTGSACCARWLRLTGVYDQIGPMSQPILVQGTKEPDIAQVLMMVEELERRIDARVKRLELAIDGLIKGWGK